MKKIILLSTIFLATLSFANGDFNKEDRKQDRKEKCQDCSMDRKQNRQNESLEEKKSQILERMKERESNRSKVESCVKSAASLDALESCKPQRPNEDRKEDRRKSNGKDHNDN